MTDWLEQIIEAAEHQGFEVRQTAEATGCSRRRAIPSSSGDPPTPPNGYG
jgi:hypothetical protein